MSPTKKNKEIRALEWCINLLILNDQQFNYGNSKEKNIKQKFIQITKKEDSEQKYNELLNILVSEYEDNSEI